MERPARMVGDPFDDVGLFVGGIIVDDGVDDFSGRDGALDAVEEANERLCHTNDAALPFDGYDGA